MLSHVGKLFVLSQVLVIACGALSRTQNQVQTGRESRIAGLKNLNCKFANFVIEKFF